MLNLLRTRFSQVSMELNMHNIGSGKLRFCKAPVWFHRRSLRKVVSDDPPRGHNPGFHGFRSKAEAKSAGQSCERFGHPETQKCGCVGGLCRLGHCLGGILAIVWRWGSWHRRVQWRDRVPYPCGWEVVCGRSCVSAWAPQAPPVGHWQQWGGGGTGATPQNIP